jgi:predicted dehydrogenase
MVAVLTRPLPTLLDIAPETLPMSMPNQVGLLNRRDVLAGSLAVACGAATSLATNPFPGGFLAGGRERLRIGLIGCGGRGTGAARQAVAAHPAVSIAAMADLFEDPLTDSVSILGRHLGDRFDTSRVQRFTGQDAWRSVLDLDLDAVILGATAWSRPDHLAAAIARGLHVYAERPAATDVGGLEKVRLACHEARSKDLVVVSGLAGRFHAPTIETLTRIHAGEIGLPTRVILRAHVGMPWHRKPVPTWTHEEDRQRNWAGDPVLSGSGLVARHIDAIDRGLQALGDRNPVSAAPDQASRWNADLERSVMAVRYRFEDGAELVVEFVESRTTQSRFEERVLGTSGTADLTTGRIDGRHSVAGHHPGHSQERHHDAYSEVGNPWQACMTGFITAILTQGRGDGGIPLCRSTAVALLGQIALATSREVTWNEVTSPTVGPIGII